MTKARPKLADYYLQVPLEQRAALAHFRRNHRPKTVSIDGTDWTYYSFGTGEQVILWLVGGIKVADVAYNYYPHLAEDFRIIAPNYPPLKSMKALADGLAGILEAEGISEVLVLAGSFGGMLAQNFVRRYPQSVKKLLLSSTTPPKRSSAQAYQRQAQLLNLLPNVLVRWLAKKQLYQTIAPAEAEAAFYRAYLHELFDNRLGKADIVSLLEAIADYMRQEYTPDDLAAWQGQLLIVDSADDATFGTMRQAMYALYPQAQVYSFTGAGHSPASTQTALFFEQARQFFQG